MSAAIKLVESLQQQGVRFELAGDTVKFRGNRELLTPDRIQALKQSKGEVVAFLQSHVAEPRQNTAAPHSQNEKPQLAQLAPIEPTVRPPNPGPVPDRVSIAGRPVTWTGKVVSLDEWRRLTDWERHGPNGKVWNGKTQQWEKSNG